MSSLTPKSFLPPAEVLVYPPIEPLGDPASSYRLEDFEHDFLFENPDFLAESFLSPKQELIDKILLSLQ